MVAKLGVAHVAQVRHLGAVADVRLLHFDERAGLGILAELVARAQVGPRADVRACADVRFLYAGTLDHGTFVHGCVDQGGVRADDGVLADHRVALQEGAGQDGGVAADLDIVLDPGGFRVKNGHAVAHPALADAADSAASCTRSFTPSTVSGSGAANAPTLPAALAVSSASVR